MRGTSVLTERYTQELLFPIEQIQPNKVDASSTFLDNMRLPVHRWFRYSAGFSAQWVEQVIEAHQDAPETVVLDPFAGSGTTLLAAESAGVQCYGIEAHPFVARIARAKLRYRSNPTSYLTLATTIRKNAAHIRENLDSYPPLIRKCFTDESLKNLDRLRQSWEKCRDNSPASELAWLTLVAVLRTASHVGTAPWQYVLPNKTKTGVLEPFQAFGLMAQTMASDMRTMQRLVTGPPASLIQSDARNCPDLPDDCVDLVITSPPYANNYDYADATRLEMSFMGEVKGWGDLQDAVRRYLVRSCSQHLPDGAIQLEQIISAEELTPIRAGIADVCARLSEERHRHGGKKTYHLMVACYFFDIAKVWASLRRVCKPGSLVCFVIGDSAPYGIYVPVITWLSELAVAAGFHSYEFEKTRDRNTKWKNRKHRVPLCEGRLWVKG